MDATEPVWSRHIDDLQRAGQAVEDGGAAAPIGGRRSGGERGRRPVNGFLNRIWTKLTRFTLTKSRLTRRRLDTFVARHASDIPALAVHSHDIDLRRHFPNAVHVSPRTSGPDFPRATPPYSDALKALPDGSREIVVCTGLLEHVPDPQATVAELSRILAPGGRLLLSASAVFAFHGAPDNYFHFTPRGIASLLGEGLEITELRGSTGPFETLAVLAQRISLQCDVFPPVRLILELMYHVLPWFDVFVIRQYDNLAKGSPCDARIGIMPATLMMVAVKSAKETP